MVTGAAVCEETLGTIVATRASVSVVERFVRILRDSIQTVCCSGNNLEKLERPEERGRLTDAE